jgi:osmotically inducible protein OsmC
MLHTGNGALTNLPYSFTTRFESEPSTNPEELIGYTHAGYFARALARTLGDARFTLVTIASLATIALAPKHGGCAITHSHLDISASIPGINADTFPKLAAKAGCLSRSC